MERDSRRGAIAAVLFDLGGVLVRFEGLEQLRGLLPGEPDLEETSRRWLQCRAVRAFERGEHGDPERFSRETVEELRLPVDSSNFLSRFESWVPGPLPGAAALLRDLRSELDPKVVLGCLSNTNPIHAERFARWFPAAFDLVFFSHETHHAKPDAAAFEHASSSLRIEPQGIWFGDDATLNVQSARERGWRAARVRGPNEARRELEDLGLLRRLAQDAP